MVETDDARDLAIKRLKNRRDFKAHLVVYVVVNAFLWLLWVFTDDAKSGVPWPIWPTLGWGIAIVLNAWNVYGSRPITEDDIQNEMKRTRGIVDVDRERREESR